MMVALSANLLAGKIGLASMTFPMNPLARGLADQILSPSATWKREARYIILLLLAGDFLSDFLLALAFILGFLNTNYPTVSVKVLRAPLGRNKYTKQ